MQIAFLNKLFLLAVIAISFLFFACSGESENEQSSSSLNPKQSSCSEQSSSSAYSSSSVYSSNSTYSSSSVRSSSSVSSSNSQVSSSSSRNQSSSSQTQSSSSQTQSSQSSSSQVQSSSSACTQISKACIDAEIEANWLRLGYSSKPTKVIALSFDDGPCTETQSLLTALKNKEVKTTFFLIGQNIRGNNAAAKAIYNDGHELANHSDGFSSLGTSTSAQTSLETCNTEIKGITGNNATLFRAPNVDYGAQLTQACKNLSLPLIGVSCWSNDYQNNGSTTPAQIRTNVKSCAGDGKIVNLHEFNTAKSNNAAGIEGLIDDLRAAGYWILPVGQMAVYKGKTLTGGTQYDNF